jgi:membrane protease subunit HflC
MKNLINGAVILVGLALFLLYNSIFIVQQTEQALVLQFGSVQRMENEPGLKFKIPFIQNVEMFDKRLLIADVDPEEVNAKDTELNITERLVIDAYFTYRITDPLQFFQSVRTISGLENQLSSIVQSSLRRTIGSYSLRDLLSEKRTEIMDQIRTEINRKAKGLVDENDDTNTPEGGFGIDVVDVRIMRADLPEEVSQSTFERMRSDFQKKAQRFRAEGEEQSLQIRSNAERERAELIAEAQKKAEVIRGEGDGIATKTYANAYNQDQEFFDFYRSMQAYEKAMGAKSSETTVILSPDNKFLKHID